jgi:Protein of unknown function (DUF4065)
MDPQQLSQLILYIVDQANDRDDIVTTIRLVKYLYLIDLEYFRVNGKLLTGLRWFFYHYGPYAFELPAIGEQIGYHLEREEFENGQKEGIIYRVDREINKPAWLGFTGESIIDRILEVWSGVETPIMLDYVYNRTEPMKNPIRGDELDFSTVQRGSKYYELNVQIDQKKGRELLKSFHETLQEETLSLVPITTTGVQNYQELVDILEKDDWPAPSISINTFSIDDSEGIILGDI